MGSCVACSIDTKRCIPAPYAPYSRWLCESCFKQKVISYWELVWAFSGTLIDDPEMGSYIKRYKEPTLKFFNKSEDMFDEDVKNFKNGTLIISRIDYKKELDEQ